MAPNLPSIYLKVYSKYIAIRRIRPRESINSRICNDTTDCQTHNKGTDHRLAANVMWTDSLVSCVVTYSTIAATYISYMEIPIVFVKVYRRKLLKVEYVTTQLTKLSVKTARQDRRSTLFYAKWTDHGWSTTYDFTALAVSWWSVHPPSKNSIFDWQSFQLCRYLFHCRFYNLVFHMSKLDSPISLFSIYMLHKRTVF